MTVVSAVRVLCCLVGLAFLMPAPPAHAQAQPPASPAPAQSADSAVSAAALEVFAKAHIAVAALRAQMQAELADPRTKKLPEQLALREKLHVNTLRLLKEHGLTEAEFARLTQRISTDNIMRKDFDALLARLPGGKTP
jgi:hypothetical protein